LPRIDRLKRSLNTAVRRDKPSLAAEILIGKELIEGRTLDYGCGFGFDADYYGWESYDPYHRPVQPQGPYDTITCILVLNVLSRNNRAKVIARIRELLADDGHAYLAVSRNIPVTGKLGINHTLQNYVVLTLPSVYADDKLEIYKMGKVSQFEDRTKDHVSLRDKRRDS
jgi:hypothetical protein